MYRTKLRKAGAHRRITYDHQEICIGDQMVTSEVRKKNLCAFCQNYNNLMSLSARELLESFTKRK